MVLASYLWYSLFDASPTQRRDRKYTWRVCAKKLQYEKYSPIMPGQRLGPDSQESLIRHISTTRPRMPYRIQRKAFSLLTNWPTIASVEWLRCSQNSLEQFRNFDILEWMNLEILCEGVHAKKKTTLFSFIVRFRLVTFRDGNSGVIT